MINDHARKNEHSWDKNMFFARLATSSCQLGLLTDTRNRFFKTSLNEHYNSKGPGKKTDLSRTSIYYLCIFFDDICFSSFFWTTYSTRIMCRVISLKILPKSLSSYLCQDICHTDEGVFIMWYTLDGLSSNVSYISFRDSRHYYSTVPQFESLAKCKRQTQTIK